MGGKCTQTSITGASPVSNLTALPSILFTRLLLAPDAGEGALDLLLEAGDQFAVGGHQRLLGFDLRYDHLLRGERWEGELEVQNIGFRDVWILPRAVCDRLPVVFRRYKNRVQKVGTHSRRWKQRSHRLVVRRFNFKNASSSNLIEASIHRNKDGSNREDAEMGIAQGLWRYLFIGRSNRAVSEVESLYPRDCPVLEIVSATARGRRPRFCSEES